MIARPASDDDIRDVFANMRAHNARELLATSFHSRIDLLADDFVAMRPRSIWIEAYCLSDGTPAALLGLFLRAPAVASVSMVMTDAWPAIGAAVVRHIRRSVIPCALVPNVRRAETWVLDAPDYPRDWLRLIGFREDSRPVVRGRNGERMVLCGWDNPGRPWSAND